MSKIATFLTIFIIGLIFWILRLYRDKHNWFCHCGTKMKEKWSVVKQRDGRISYIVDLTCPKCGEKIPVLYKTKGVKK